MVFCIHGINAQIIQYGIEILARILAADGTAGTAAYLFGIGSEGMLFQKLNPSLDFAGSFFRVTDGDGGISGGCNGLHIFPTQNGTQSGPANCFPVADDRGTGEQVFTGRADAETAESSGVFLPLTSSTQNG